jgi:hypothetical protein
MADGSGATVGTGTVAGPGKAGVSAFPRQWVSPEEKKLNSKALGFRSE